ncbi:hypothetical protein BJP05_00390 [Corynebacterium sp. NML98-0116]|uniref:DUF488 domain-containing protein n=1 Tax=Corynebacterium TaxID=1716 RepID=UPI0008783C28|nr:MULTISPECIES: DUF488 domain-containing protein [Corynebacterium]AOX04808.1 hypothetical protein BJP05_00390 [Corynebacterium sp. NML98-0116]OFT29296.1 hypothetical protein HMPREF3170_06820 [Corynebacterium sp. HMSC08D02]UUA87199.1 DUF488 domain-containing protein [Corynebacterium pseudogenitalium]
MRIYTLGFSHKSAEEFFDILRESGVRRVVDIRRSNTNQLAGFTKKDDLRYFLRVILDMPYTHELALAPSADLMHAYRHDEVGFDEFSKQLREEYDAGEVSSLDRSLFDDAVLLCSEADPSTCHRLVAAEYLAEVWDDVEIVHL